MSYIGVLLNASHKKKEFSCGKDSLDSYIQKQASQDIKKKMCACFVFSEKDHIIKGYYTLSNDNIPLEEIPEEIKSKMPKGYHHLPVTLLGRLAVDTNFKGQKLGELLLLDALRRSHDVSQTSIGSMAVVVDPIDGEAVGFYKKYGFVVLPDSGRMFLAMKTIETLFR
jgi:predicted GNAT family N-acyltransferase